MKSFVSRRRQGTTNYDAARSSSRSTICRLQILQLRVQRGLYSLPLAPHRSNLLPLRPIRPGKLIHHDYFATWCTQTHCYSSFVTAPLICCIEQFYILYWLSKEAARIRMLPTKGCGFPRALLQTLHVPAAQFLPI